MPNDDHARPGAVSRRLVLGGAAAGIVATGWPAGAQAAATPARVGTWATAPYRLPDLTFAHQTARFVVHTSVGGQRPQVRLSNVAGTTPLTIDRVFLGRHAGSGAIVAGTNHPVSFSGNPGVTIAAGATALSDPIDFALLAEDDLAISVYVAATVAEVTGHSIAAQRSYVSTDGDHAAEESASAYTTNISKTYWIDELSVELPGSGGAVACVGDSITDGVGSTYMLNQRWPDYLARRLLARPAPIGVLNEGISGNRILYDGGSPSTQARLDRDVLSHPGVHAVILLEGINDINSGRAAVAGDLISAYRQVRNRLQVHGIRLIVATITPWGGAAGFTAPKEQLRLDVNAAIRTGGYFDGVVDFDLAVQDPSNPTLLLGAYDSGGGVHPNSRGYEAMANAVDLALLDPTL
ncbi:SGNH/GDSL hydrolase family protein [Kribbella sp. NPDC055071]